MDISSVAATLTVILEGFGMAVISIAVVLSTGSALRRVVARATYEKIYEHYRRDVGRGVLLGLEFLVAADIIHTVAVELSFESLGTLGAIVLIRTFLSVALEVEIEGRWPWEANRPGSPLSPPT